MANQHEVRVPDIGDFSEVDVVEVLAAVGDLVAVDDPLITLETDKASMEVVADVAGKITAFNVEAGGTVSEGAVVAVIEAAEPAEETTEAAEAEAPAASKKEAAQAPNPKPEPAPEPKPAASPAPATAAKPDAVSERDAFQADPGSMPYASPSVRKFARELGVDLTHVKGSGRKGRIVQDDVKSFVKQAMAGTPAPAAAPSGSGIPPVPAVDFSKFGEIEEVKLSRIRKVSAANLHRSWLNVPHVTQHEDADITDMEAFRKAHGDEAKKQGFKLTPIVFIMKAVVAALQKYPDFNSSLSPDGEALIRKKYFHIGIAVDTPNGLVVPVIRDCDQKSLFQLAKELGEVSGRMREGKIKPADLQGACFTISSLGGIGGTAFTPIVNAPEVAILGLSRSSLKPVWQDDAFVPRLMLPLSLSYDHRVIDGAAAARFTAYLAHVLGDLRRLLL
ncbi:dihydrolipoyllysine-residue acetyltransferase [Acanthopleuribacter pedis]|uniref:Acetyltransferase component of pyruvate dehydrogenase complex n=1 Tax=Acanthopleuribacter pedis TaxID=442870 RepID=A0A8J7QCQ4_9BACT|nr:dihydrolipoyllysine-residue acetyltransferase [Acanthopleuribacter pedis]